MRIEIALFVFVCSACTGPTGPQGQMGDPGTMGVMGDPGTQGDPGPAGVVAIVPVDENLVSAVPSTSGLPAGFSGGTTLVTTTTATQRITGTISTYVDSATVLTNINYLLCYRATGDTSAPTFATTTSLALRLAVGAREPLTAAGSFVPGAAGSWDVGICIGADSDIQGGAKQGFFQVTN
jgi:hypothetical protein